MYRFSLCLALIAWTFPSIVFGATSTWNNTGTDWNTAADWTGGLPPAGLGNLNGAYFTNPAVTNPNLSASYTVSTVQFGVSGYTISSSSSSITLTLQSYGTSGVSTNWALDASNTSGTNTISAPIVLDPSDHGTQPRGISVFGQSAGGTLVLGGQISQYNNSGVGADLWLTAGGTIDITGTNNSYSGASAGTSYSGTIAVGGTNISNGTTVEVASLSNSGGNGSLGTGVIVIGGQVPGGSAASSGTLDYMGSGGSFNQTVTISGTGSTAATISTAGATGALTLSGTTIAVTSTGATLTLTGSNTGNVISSNIGNNGSTALAKTGTGGWTLSGTNTYAGATTVSAGTLEFANPGSLYNSTSGSWTAANLTTSSGATLAFGVGSSGFSQANISTLNTNLIVNASGTASNGFKSGSFIGLDTQGGTFNPTNTFATTHGGGTLGLVKLGTGTLVLNQASTYSGGTTVENGTLSATANSNGTSGAFGVNTGAVTLGDAVTTTGGYSPTLLITGNFTVSNPITVSSNATTGAYTIGGSGSSGNTPTYSSAITLNQGVTLASAAGVTTDFSSSGTWTTNNNPFTIGSSGNTGTVKIDDAISSTTSGTTITVTNGSTLNLTNTGNSFLGAVAVQSGTLSFSTGSTSATAAQSLGSNNSTTTGATAVTLGKAGTSSGTLNYTGSSATTLAKEITALGNGSDMIETTGGGQLTLTGGLVKNGTTLTLNAGSGGINVNSVISGSVANSDMDFTNGTTMVSQAATYNGPTWIYGGGVVENNVSGGALPSGTNLNIGTPGAAGAATSTSTTAGTFDLYGNNQTVTQLNTEGTGPSYASDLVTNSGSANATLTVSGGGSFAGVIQDGATHHTGLAVTGGALTLSGQNTYSFGTSISSGTLYVNNGGGASYSAPITNPHATITATNTTGSGTGTGAVTVGSGGTLAGSGTIAPTSGGVTVQSGGTLSSGGVQSGTTAGTGLTINNSANLTSALTVNGGATLTFALGSSTPYNGGSGALAFANPNTNSTYLSLTGTATDQIFSNTTTADNIKLVDLTNGSLSVSLTLRSQNPYLLIQTDPTGAAAIAADSANPLDADFSNLWTSGGEGQNGYVLGVSTGVGSAYTAFNINAYDINGNQVNTSSNLENLRLYLYNGDLEVVPEPGTWALMLGGLALLILVQRQKRKHD